MSLPRKSSHTTNALMTTDAPYRPLPDGLAIKKYYRKALAWSNEQWAWEFLWRNKQFQEDSKMAEDDPSQRKRVATKWGLVTFKSAREPYEGKSGKPRFAFTRLRVKVASDHAAREENVLKLNRGEIGLAIRLDLLTSELAVRHAVARLQRAIRRRVPAEALLGRDRSLQTQNLVEVLRVFDARRANISWLDAARAIVPRNANDPNPDKGDWDGQTAKEALRGLKEKADQLVAGDYIYLALATEKLKVEPHASFVAAIKGRRKIGTP